MKPDRRGLTILSIATVVATWLLLVIGGLVNPTGSSMACPDWYFIPTCNGQVIPADWSGGILYEHGHRMWASGVGLLTLVLGVWMWRRRDLGDTTRRLGLGAIALVALQGTLGGITVKLNLSWVVSTMHLVTAMIFFSVLIIITGRVLAAPAPPSARAVGPRALVVSAALLVAFQIALGGIVRHLGAGLVCGDDWLGCGPGTFWPAGGAGQIHMFHRVVGYSVALILLVVAGRAARALQQDGRPSWPARIPAILVLVQVTLGLLTVASGRSLWIVTFHTAVAGLVLASLVALYLTLGPLGSPRRAREAGRAALQPTLAALHAEVSP
ncbi:MAG: heme A synthase [Deltaproteobacteria bacterium]|nr:heme A synthase [Deltaproteobacteria bacterium]MCB9788288.1 heme A synthase [Deltaproteobacteria bacterium]